MSEPAASIVTTSHSAGRSRGANRSSAFGNDLRRFWNLTLMLAATEFKLKYFGSALGYVWSLMRPILLFGVLYFVFTTVARVGDSVRFYAPYLLTSIVFFTFFAEASTGSVPSLVNRESLLRKMRFPRLVVPLSVCLTALFNFGTNLIAVAVFAFASGVRPHWQWVEMPFLLLALMILATGLSMLLSALYVRYKDVQPIWEVLSQAIFYGSAVLYTVDSIDQPTVRQGLMLNPIAAILTQMRHAFLDPSAPSAAYVAGGAWRLVFPAVIVVVVFVLGLWTFQREAPLIAERL